MKWFQHESALHDEPEFADILDSPKGLERYGFLMLLMEEVCAHIDSGERCLAEYSLREWSRRLRVTTAKCSRLFRDLAVSPLCHVDHIETHGLKKVRIAIPKLLQLKDEYTRKVRTRSGEPPEKVALPRPSTLTSTYTDTDPPIPKEPKVLKGDLKPNGSPAESLGTNLGELTSKSILSRIQEATGDDEHWQRWWASVVMAFEQRDRLLAFDALLRYVEDCADPVIRRAKDLGELKHPGAFLCKKTYQAAREFDITLPQHPGKTAGAA